MGNQLKFETLVLSGDDLFERLGAILETMKACPVSVSVNYYSPHIHQITIGYVEKASNLIVRNYPTTISMTKGPIYHLGQQREFSENVRVLIETLSEKPLCFCVYSGRECNMNVLAIYESKPPATMWDYLND